MSANPRVITRTIDLGLCWGGPPHVRLPLVEGDLIDAAPTRARPAGVTDRPYQIAWRWPGTR